MPSRPLYLPHLDIEVARTIRYRGHAWYDLHEDLAKESLRMPLLHEFIALLKADKLYFNNGQELSSLRRRAIQRGIRGKENETYGELLDAQFFLRNGQWHLHQRHHLGSNGIDLQFEELSLENILLSTGAIDFADFSSLGIPSQLARKGTILYRPPHDRGVACYSVKNGKASLLLDYDPNTVDLCVGVRAVRDRRCEVA